jgi:cold shock CspA family protein
MSDKQLATFYSVNEDGVDYYSWCSNCHTWHEHGDALQDFNKSTLSLGFRVPHCPDKDPEYELINHGEASDAIKADAQKAYPVGPSKLGHAVRMSTMTSRKAYTGVVQTLVPMKGFGFILMDFTSRVFFHVSQWRGGSAPVVGQEVSFVVVPPRQASQKYPMAVNVRPTEGVK